MFYKLYLRGKFIYRKTSNKRRTLVGNEIVDHSDVVGASFNGLDKDNCKTRQDTFKFCDLVCLILKIWW